MSSYSIPAELASAQIEIKKSRFISYAKHIASREEGLAWLEAMRQQYPDARHHCWAYLLGNPLCAINAGMGDDGEPSGTAGKPILNVLQHKLVGDIMIIVIRYFGGVKLGAGGLTRAYSQAAQSVMEVLKIQHKITRSDLSIDCDFGLEQDIRHQLSLIEGDVVQVAYHQAVTLQVSIPEEAVEAFCRFLKIKGCVFTSD